LKIGQVPVAKGEEAEKGASGWQRCPELRLAWLSTVSECFRGSKTNLSFCFRRSSSELFSLTWKPKFQVRSILNMIHRNQSLSLS